jgi:adenosylcobinamide kinase/adenosylcobinamide-phosphate guanylyltransferase
MSARLVTLVLGGARSGKSRHAEALARATGFERIYIATAEAFDAEMTERIAHHRTQRAGDGWTTVEAPLDLPRQLRQQAGPARVVLVDCLTLWLSNLMLGDHPLAPAEAALIAALEAADGPVILVSNEVGLGLVPETPLGRAFRDAQGRLNQRLAALAERVQFIAAGLPLTLKEPSP